MKKALLIGINYVNMSGELRGCYNDVKNMKRILKEKYNYDEIRVLSEYDNNMKPTRSNILKNIEWLISDQTKFETLFFHYSGHGSSVIDRNNDEEDGKDEVLVPLDYTTAGMIKDDLLNNVLIQKIHKNTKFYSVVDACHSGSIFDLKYSAEPFCIYEGKSQPLYELNSWSSVFKLKQTENYTDKPNLFIISGCRDNQTSADDWIAEERSCQGALTYHLIKALEDFKFDVTLDKLMKKINIYMHVKQYEQRPIFSSGKYLHLDDKFTF